jgi:hypothetical protein
MHGGAPGSGAPTGARNGNYRHGRYTKEIAATRQWLREASSLILFSFSAAKFGCRIALMMICGYGRVLTDGSTGFQGLPSHGREQLN